MSKSNKVKCSVALIKFIANKENQCDPFKFKLLNGGDDVSYKIYSQKGRKYEIDNVYGTLLKGHCIDICIKLHTISPDVFNSDDMIAINFFTKESSNFIQCIEVPVKVVMSDAHKSQSLSSLQCYETLESPCSLRKRVKQPSIMTSCVEDSYSFQQHQLAVSHSPSLPGSSGGGGTSIRSPSPYAITMKKYQHHNSNQTHIFILWLFKKLIFLLVCSICVIIIVLPLKGYPLADPHPMDNWVNHLARVWPSYLFPNHIAQYLAILILGAAMAIFLFIY